MYPSTLKIIVRLIQTHGDSLLMIFSHSLFIRAVKSIVKKCEQSGPVRLLGVDSDHFHCL